MKARILEISERSIYLEVDSQIRFWTDYCEPAPALRPSADDRIEFHFDTRFSTPRIAIDALTPASLRRTLIEH